MTKPTGRPRGRPKTKEYVTLMARVPQDLATRVQRYAGLHQQTISDVLRDGLLVLLQEEEPHRFYMSDINTDPGNASDAKRVFPDIMSDTKEVHATRETQPDIESDEKEAYSAMVPDMKEGNATQDIQSVIMPDTKEGNADADITSDTKDRQPNNASDSNTDTEKASDKKEVSAQVPFVYNPAIHKLGTPCKRNHLWKDTGQSVRYKRGGSNCVVCHTEHNKNRKTTHQQEHNGNTPERTLPPAAPECPPFDATKRVLGNLCPGKHEWGSTGQSLLRKTNRGCLDCEREWARERRRQKAQGTT